MVDVDFFSLIFFLLNFTVAACDDTAFFFAGCIHDCLNQDDDDCLMRIMIARSEVKILFILLQIYIFVLLAELSKQNKLSIANRATRHGNNLFSLFL